MDFTYLYLFFAGALGGFAHGLLPFIELDGEGKFTDLGDRRAWGRAFLWAFVGGVAGFTTLLLDTTNIPWALAVLAGFGGPLLLRSSSQRVAEMMQAVRLRSSLTGADAHLAEAEARLAGEAGPEALNDSSGEHPALASIKRARDALRRRSADPKAEG